MTLNPSVKRSQVEAACSGSLCRQVVGLHEDRAAQAGLCGGAGSFHHAAGRRGRPVAPGGPSADPTSEPAAGLRRGVHRRGRRLTRSSHLSPLCRPPPLPQWLHAFSIFFFFTPSGLLLWSLSAVHLLGPGAVQQGLLSDTPRPLGHASSSHAVPAGLEDWDAGCEGGLPHVLCQGL